MNSPSCNSSVSNKEAAAYERRLDRASIMLAAAFWRGRLGFIDAQTRPGDMEALIAAGAESTKDSWRGSARIILGP